MPLRGSSGSCDAVTLSGVVWARFAGERRGTGWRDWGGWGGEEEIFCSNASLLKGTRAVFFVALSVNSHSMVGASDVEARVVNCVSGAEGGVRREREGGGVGGGV